MRPTLPSLLLLAACAPVPSAPPPATWVRHVPSIGWRDLPGYSVAMPREIERQHAQGIDSEVASFEGPGLSIVFDYGMYGGVPGCAPGPDCRNEQLKIDGRAAEAVTMPSSQPPYGLAYHVGIPVKERRFEIGAPFEPAVSLTMHAQCRDADACELARRIARTIDFGSYPEVTPQPPLPGP